MKSKYITLSIALCSILGVSSCDSYLDINPKQVLDQNILNKPSDIEGFVTAAYARMCEMGSLDSSPYMYWWSGSMRSDDCYKGGGGVADAVGSFGNISLFTYVNPNTGALDGTWYNSYQVIQRCNTAIQRMANFTEEELPNKNSFMGEMLFIRSFTLYRLKKLWKYVPYIDENVVGMSDAFEAVPNRELDKGNDLYLWQRILDDFKKAEELLPLDQMDKGRVSRNAATAMVARTILNMAYEQDDRHQVININKEYYDKLIENAKDYNAKAKLNPIASPNDFVNTTDFMTNRDTEAQGYQTAQTGLANQLPEDAKKDLDYEVKLLELAQEKGFEEAKLVVLGNQRITQREREYQLAILENLQKVEAINKNTEQLNLEKSALEKKDKLTRDEKMRLEEINAILAKNTNEIALTNREIENLKTERLIEQLRPIADIIKDTFRSMGLGKTADEFDSFYKAILNKNATFAEKFQESMELVGAFASDMIAKQTERTIANLDEQLKASQSATEQEVGFIQSRLDMMNAIEDATKEQIAERNALEDEARTIREQQLQKEKLIGAQKARAMQKAQAQQTLINVGLAATQTMAQLGFPLGVVPAALALAFGGLQAALIMSRNPVPKYFVGRKDGKEEIAWTQEKGREIITDRSGKIKSLGSDDGAVLTKLSAGDRVYTASETAKILSEMEGMPKVGNELYRKIAKRDVSPIFIQNEKIDYEQLAQKVGEKFEQVSKKYDKIAYFEDEKGNMFSQKGGQFPVFRGKKRKQSIVINTPRNERN